ncbi:ATP-binding protein [Akkermansiaceae bacterium]|nr:ATP-binding protein [bacterium]MDB4514774.1 ATP-binding protein [Akkermansiaceae bacterium]MDC0280082.1 ATP-binding protein [Akkermansiaceae bacterium]
MNQRTFLLISLQTAALTAETKTQPLELSLSQNSDDLSSPTFKVDPGQDRFRFRLRGLESRWEEPPDTMNVVVRFFQKDTTESQRIAFPVSGSSEGWNDNIENSRYSSQTQSIPIPSGFDRAQVIITSSGSPQSLGVFSIRNLNVSIFSAQNEKKLLVDGFNPIWTKTLWKKSGTRPSMAQPGPTFPAELRLIDDDLKTHADWVTPPMPIVGDRLQITWKEAFSIGAGGPTNPIYDRLPPGNYQLQVERINVFGKPSGEISTIELEVPRPIWQTWWFWLLNLIAVVFLVFLFGRSIVKRRVRRAIRHTRLIENERLRIAMDLHDDIGTSLSQISLAGSHARFKAKDSHTKASIQEMIDLAGNLSASLSETVWMLNPKNNDLESLIVFLSRISSELCRTANFRCRINAIPTSDDIPISREFRHHFVLSVKEAFNNALKHSRGSEAHLEIKIIQCKGKHLSITISDDGIGLDETRRNSGNGLGSLKRRMNTLGGTCHFQNPDSGGTAVCLFAPLKQNEL